MLPRPIYPLETQGSQVRMGQKEIFHLIIKTQSCAVSSLELELKMMESVNPLMRTE
jgi:hypothetical protein